MWFESKHSFFKKAPKHSNNFRDITATLREKHQLRQAYLQTEPYFTPFELKSSSKYSPRKTYLNLSQCNNCQIKHNAKDLSIVCSVSIYGTEFKIGHAILLVYDFPVIKIWKIDYW